MKHKPRVTHILANGERSKEKMKKITIGLVLLLIGMATVDSASQVAPLALMAVGMVLMWRGGKNEKLF